MHQCNSELDRCCENLKVRQNSINILQILYNKQRQSSCILKQNEREHIYIYIYVYVCMYMHWVRLKVTRVREETYWTKFALSRLGFSKGNLMLRPTVYNLSIVHLSILQTLFRFHNTINNDFVITPVLTNDVFQPRWSTLEGSCWFHLFISLARHFLISLDYPQEASRLNNHSIQSWPKPLIFRALTDPSFHFLQYESIYLSSIHRYQTFSRFFF